MKKSIGKKIKVEPQERVVESQEVQEGGVISSDGEEIALEDNDQGKYI